ncbi:16907_t:CDS:2, partial [Gigaspora margarita]
MSLKSTKSEALLQISSSLTQYLPSDITQNVCTSNSLITEQDLRDELTMDNPFSRQNLKKDTPRRYYITNATNPWVTPSTSEIYAEQISTESNISYNKMERTPVGLEGLTDDCFFENIDNMIRLSEQKTKDRNLYGSDKEMEVEPSDSSKNTKEEITHKEKEETPIVASVSPDIEMVAESADPLRDELADLYGNAGDKGTLPPVAAETNTSVGDMQASMLSQVTNIELDNFKVLKNKAAYLDVTEATHRELEDLRTQLNKATELVSENWCR